MLVKITTKYASYSLVTFVTHKIKMKDKKIDKR